MVSFHIWDGILSPANSKSGPRDAGADGRYSNALARGIRLIRAFQPGETFLGVSELARRVRAPKSTVSRLLFTLADLGLLNRDERLEKYELSPSVLTLGHAALLNVPFRVGAQRLLALASEPPYLIAGFGVMTETCVTYLDVQFGALAPRLIMATGHRSSLAHTAIGWASLSAVPPARRAILTNRLAQVYPSEWPRLSRRIRRAIVSMKTNGYCIAWPSEDPDYCTIGTAFASFDGSAVYAFNLVGRVTDLQGRHSRRKLGMWLARQAQHLRLSLDPRPKPRRGRGIGPMPGEVR